MVEVPSLPCPEGPNPVTPEAANQAQLEVIAPRTLSDHEKQQVGELRAMTNVLIERLQFMREAGITFKGLRDLYEIFGYDRIITNKQYRDRYARGGIAKRIVEALPKATWRNGFEVFEDEDPKTDTVFEVAWKSMYRRLRVNQVFYRADILTGLSNYSIILIGGPGDDISQPLPKGNAPDQILYLTPFSAGGGPGLSQGGSSGANYVDATIQTFVTDVKDPRFGQPLTYQLRRLDVTSPSLQKPVHWSRILHLAEGLLDNETYGTPTLEDVWNLLDDLDKVTGGGAEAFFIRANQGLHVDVDKTMEMNPDAKADLKNQLEDYQHKIARALRTRGVTVETLGSDVANFSGPADTILTQIAGTKSIPKRILTGSEMGELASSQDRDNWKDQVHGRQMNHAEPTFVRQLIDRLMDFGYLPKPKKEYQVEFKLMETLTEDEKAKGAVQWATVNSTQGTPVFTDDEIRDHWYGMEPLTDDQKTKIAAMKEQFASQKQIPAKDEGGNDVNSDGTPFKALQESELELLRVLESAIECNNVAVIDAIIGLDRDAELRDLGGPGSGWFKENGHVPDGSAGDRSAIHAIDKAMDGSTHTKRFKEGAGDAAKAHYNAIRSHLESSGFNVTKDVRSGGQHTKLEHLSHGTVSLSRSVFAPIPSQQAQGLRADTTVTLRYEGKTK